MHPADFVLIAYIPTPADLQRAQEAHWYRIPLVHAPLALRHARAIAFYQGRAFGEARWQVAWWSYIEQVSVVRRRDLLPEEPQHPHANDFYVKVHLAELKPRVPPLVGQKGRRLLFKTITWSAFCRAESLEELFNEYRLEKDPLYAIIRSQLSTEELFGIADPDSPHQLRLFEQAAHW